MSDTKISDAAVDVAAFAVPAAVPTLEHAKKVVRRVVALYLQHSQPAELAEQQGVDTAEVGHASANRKLLRTVRAQSDRITELEAALAARQPGASNQVVEKIEQLAVDTQPGAQVPDAYLVQAVKDGEAWEHRWYIPRWGDPDPSALAGTVYEIRGKKHPELGTYRVKPFYAAPPAQGIDMGPRPMDTAPRDGTMVRLLVQFEDHATEDTAEPAWTIGACNDDNVGEGERMGWQFAGWCWTHDHFTEGKGTPVGWLPLIDGQRDAAPGVGNG